MGDFFLQMYISVNQLCDRVRGKDLQGSNNVIAYPLPFSFGSWEGDVCFHIEENKQLM